MDIYSGQICFIGISCMFIYRNKYFIYRGVWFLLYFYFYIFDFNIKVDIELLNYLKYK